MGVNEEYVNTLRTYLALAMSVGLLLSSGCSYATWHGKTSGDFIAQVFTRQAIAMIWDFAEANLLF